MKPTEEVQTTGRDIYEEGHAPNEVIDFAPNAPSATYAKVMSWPGFKGPYLETRKKIRAMREATRAARAAEWNGGESDVG